MSRHRRFFARDVPPKQESEQAYLEVCRGEERINKD